MYAAIQITPFQSGHPGIPVKNIACQVAVILICIVIKQLAGLQVLIRFFTSSFLRIINLMPVIGGKDYNRILIQPQITKLIHNYPHMIIQQLNHRSIFFFYRC